MNSSPLLDATHEPARLSHVTAANVDGAEFPIQNLPFGVFSTQGRGRRIGVAIGDHILDLATADRLGLFEECAADVRQATICEDLAELFRLGRPAMTALRRTVAKVLDERFADAATVRSALVPMNAAALHLPVPVTAFTDMCASTFHIGRRRGNDAYGQPICPPAFRTIPIGYDGRAGSVQISDHPVTRPNGTWQPQHDGGEPRFGPEPRLDYELELGMWIGGEPNPPGTPISVEQAEQRIVGFCLLNDWSARGIQFWETMLGPFLGKSIATTLSPWVVTADALAPFRAPAFARPSSDPPVPAHLYNERDRASGGIDLAMEAWRDDAVGNRRNLCRTNFRHMYWTPAQMVAHHASNGCSLSVGNLIGSGTASGPEYEAAACLIERIATASAGSQEHDWLADGDSVTLHARAERSGYRTIGFGEATASVLPAPNWPGPARK